MKKTLVFNIWYLLFTIILFLTEVYIAIYVNDDFIRPYFGDYLVVILIYCFIKSFLSIDSLKAALLVLAISYAIETLQFFHFISLIGLGKSRLANLVLGNSFAWIDLVAYTVGVATIIAFERMRKSTQT